MSDPLTRIPPHLVRKDFLPPEEHAALLDWVMTHRSEVEVSRIGQGALNPAVRNSQEIRRQLPQPVRAALRGGIRAQLSDLREALGLAPFEVDRIELTLVVYNDGAYYRRHADTAGGADVSRRMLTGVYYFHAEPQGFTGGMLRLHALSAPPGGPAAFVDIPPAQNSLAVFPSWAPHEVLPVACPSARYEDSRFAINCWVRRAPAG